MKLRDRRQLPLGFDGPAIVVGVVSIEPPLRSRDDQVSLVIQLEKIEQHPESFTGTRFMHRGSLVTIYRLRRR